MAVTLDNTAIGNNGAGATTVDSAPLTTADGNRLLLATISSVTESVSSVSGGGLTWAKVTSAALPTGEKVNGSTRLVVWYAFATVPLAAVTITATLASSAQASIVVSAYAGVNSQGVNGNAAIGSVQSGSGTSTTPSAVGGNVWTNSIWTGHLAANLTSSAAAGSGETINGQDHGTTSALCAQSMTTASFPTVNTSTTVDFTIASAAWAVIMVEIVADGIQVSDNPNANITQNSKTAGTTLTSPGIQNQARGTSIIVFFAMDDAAGTVSCADTSGGSHTYNVDVDISSGGSGTGARVVIFSAHRAVTLNPTITVTHPSVTARAMAILQVTGIDTLDRTASATGSSASPSSGVTTARTKANEILIGAIASEGPGTTGEDTFTAGTGFTHVTKTGFTFTVGTTGGGAASNMSLGAEYKIVSAIGTDAATATITSRDWACAIATYYRALLTPQLLEIGTTQAEEDLSSELPAAFEIGSDIPEVASAVVNVVLSSSTAEGETPQQHAIIESQGGGTGQSRISPGKGVRANVAVTGAGTDVGLTGTTV